MTILIDDKEAILKKGSSFDYISENRLFTGSDSYTLSMTFPLADCPQTPAPDGKGMRVTITLRSQPEKKPAIKKGAVDSVR